MSKRIAVIGLGPGGLATLKVLLDSMMVTGLANDLNIEAFEALDSIGGVWNYTPSDSSKPDHATMYDNLETNLHKDLMKFTDFDFEPSSPSFPTRQNVIDYLKQYYKTKIIEHHAEKFAKGLVKIHFNTRIEEIAKHYAPERNTWKLKTSNDSEVFMDFDYLIVGTGHFLKPALPKDIEGYEEWDLRHPTTLMHSKYYKNPKAFKNKKVIVVGGSSSGGDLVTQISSAAVTPVYWSVFSPEKMVFPVSSLVRYDVGEIKRLDYCEKSVTFANGLTITDVDSIIFATGFQYDFKEFHKGSLPMSFSLENEGKLIKGLYKQLVLADDPSVFFTLLPKNVVPFKLAEVQASLITTIINEKFPIDLIKPDTIGENYHALSSSRDMAYHNELYKLIESHNPAIFESFKPTYWEGEIHDKRLKSAGEKQSRQIILNKLAHDCKKNSTDYKIPF